MATGKFLEGGRVEAAVKGARGRGTEKVAGVRRIGGNSGTGSRAGWGRDRDLLHLRWRHSNCSVNSGDRLGEYLKRACCHLD